MVAPNDDESRPWVRMRWARERRPVHEPAPVLPVDPGKDRGSGQGLFAALAACAVVAALVAYAAFRTWPAAHAHPQLHDRFAAFHPGTFELTGAAASRDGSRLFVTSRGGGLTTIDARLLRANNEQPGPEGGPASADLRDVAVGPDDSLLAITHASGSGADCRTAAGVWRRCIAPLAIEGLDIDQVVRVLGSDRALVLILADGRLVHYAIAERELTLMSLAGAIPAPVTSAAATATPGDDAWTGWLVAAGGLVRVEIAGRVARAEAVAAPSGARIVEVAAVGERMFARTGEGGLYRYAGSQWEPIWRGSQWPGLSLAKARFAAVSGDGARLWLIPAAGATPAVDVGVYSFADRTWATGRLPDGARIGGDAPSPVIADDGNTLLLANAAGGVLVLGVQRDQVVEIGCNLLGGDRLMHASGSADEVLLTTVASTGTHRVRSFRWEKLRTDPAALGTVLRASGRAEFEDADVLEVVPDAARLLFVDRHGRVTPYDLKRRGFERPRALTGVVAPPLCATRCNHWLWVVGADHAVTRFDLAGLGQDTPALAGEQIASGQGLPAGAVVCHALVAGDGFDVILADGTAWNYSFGSAWQRVGEGLQADELMRLADGTVVGRDAQGKLLRRGRAAWESVAANGTDARLRRLFAALPGPLACTEDGALGWLRVDATWRLEPWIAATPTGEDRPGPVFSAAAAAADDAALILGDGGGLVVYEFATHRWQRVCSKAQAEWVFASTDAEVFALDRHDQQLHRVARRAPFATSMVLDQCRAVAATADSAIALSVDGRLHWLTGRAPRNLPLSNLPGDIGSSGVVRSATTFGDQALVVGPEGTLYAYSVRAGVVESVRGPWRTELRTVVATPRLITVLAVDGRAWASPRLRAAWDPVELPDQPTIASIGACGDGVALLTAGDGVALLTAAGSAPVVLCGGARPQRSPGVLTSVVLDGERLLLGGAAGIAERSPSARALIERSDAGIGGIRRFDLVADQLFAWTDQGLAIEGDAGFIRLAPPGFRDLVEVTRAGRRQWLAFDRRGLAHVLAPGTSPTPDPWFGGEAVSAAPITHATALAPAVTLLAFADGTLATYLENERRLVTTRPAGRRVVYLGGDAASGCVAIVREGAALQLELLPVTAQGAFRQQPQVLGGIRDWVLVDPQRWHAPDDNLFVLRADRSILTVRGGKDGVPRLVAPLLGPVERVTEVSVHRVVADREDLLVLDSEGVLSRHDARRAVADQLAKGVIDIWPVRDGLVRRHAANLALADRELSLGGGALIRGDGSEVVVWDVGATGVQRLGAGEQPPIQVRSTSRPSGLRAAWATAASGDVLFGLDHSGRPWRYDASRANWQRQHDVEGDFHALVGAGAVPTAAIGDNSILDFATGVRVPLRGVPAVSAAGAVAFLDVDGSVRQLGGNGAGVVFRPRPVVPAGATHRWSVPIAGGVVIGLDRAVLRWDPGAERPEVLQGSEQLPTTEGSWFLSASGEVAWFVARGHQGIHEITAAGVAVRSTRPVRLLGTVGDSVVAVVSDGSVRQFEVGGVTRTLLPVLDGSRPVRECWRSANGDRCLALNSAGDLLARAEAVPGTQWTPMAGAKWQVVEAVDLDGPHLIARGQGRDGRQRTVVIDGETGRLRMDLIQTASGLAASDGSRQFVQEGAFAAIAQGNWMLEGGSGEIVDLEPGSSLPRGRLVVGEHLAVEPVGGFDSARVDARGRLWVDRGGVWQSYASWRRGGAPARREHVLPAVPVVALDQVVGGHKITLADGRQIALAGDRFTEDGTPGSIPEGMELLRNGDGLAAHRLGSATPLFVVRPGEPWPGTEGAEEVVFVDGALHPVRSGWPALDVAVSPERVAGAVVLGAHTWSVPVAGRERLLVDRVGESLRVVDSAGLGAVAWPPILAAEMPRLAGAHLRHDGDGPWFDLGGGAGLAWTGGSWHRRPGRATEPAIRELVDGEGRLAVDRWQSMSTSEAGLHIETAAGAFTIAVAEFANPRPRRLEGRIPPAIAAASQPPGVEDVTLTGRRWQWRDRRTGVVRGLDLVRGLVAADDFQVIAAPLDGDGSWLAKSVDGRVWRLGAHAPLVVGDAFRAPPKPPALAAAGRFDVRDSSLCWLPAALTASVAMGAWQEPAHWPADALDDLMPAGADAILVLNGAGLWRWSATGRAPIGLAGSILTGSQLRLIRSEQGFRVVVASGGSCIDVAGPTPARLPAETVSFEHPAEVPGSAGVLTWRPDGRTVEFEVQVRRGDARLALPTRFTGGAFDFELADSLVVRDGRVGIVAMAARTAVESAVTGRDGIVHHALPFTRPVPPEVVRAAGAGVRFRRATAETWVPEIRAATGAGPEWIESRRSANGQFAHDLVQAATSTGTGLLTSTAIGLIAGDREGLIRRAPLPPLDRVDRLTVEGDHVFAGTEDSAAEFDGRTWRAVPLSASPFAAHRWQVIERRAGPWRARPSSDGFTLDHVDGFGGAEGMQFVASAGAFASDLAAGEDARMRVRHGVGVVQWETRAGWLQAAPEGRFGRVDGDVAAMTPAERLSADGSLRVGCSGGPRPLTVRDDAGHSQDVAWSVVDSRLPIDRVQELLAVPGARVFVLATSAGVRELRIDDGRVTNLPFELEPEQPAWQLIVGESDQAFVRSGSRSFTRQANGWTPCPSELHERWLAAGARAAGATADGRLRWERPARDGLQLAVHGPGGTLPALWAETGFAFDRPTFVAASTTRWLAVDGAWLRCADPALGIRGLERSGEAPDRVQLRATPDGNPCIVAERAGRVAALDAAGVWQPDPSLHPNLWRAFLLPDVLVTSRDDGLTVDWQPTGAGGAPPPRVQLQTRDGRFLHDLVQAMATVGQDRAEVLVFATAAGLTLRRGQDHRLVDVEGRLDDRSGPWRLLPTAAGVAITDGGRVEEVVPTPHVGRGAEVIAIPVHDSNCLRLTRTPAGRFVLAERLDDGSLGPIEPIVQDGHLPGDVVVAAQAVGDRRWLMTSAGLQRDSSEGWTGFLRPEQSAGRLADEGPPIPGCQGSPPIRLVEGGVLLAFAGRAPAGQSLPMQLGPQGLSPVDADAWRDAVLALHRRPGWAWRQAGAGADLELFADGWRGGGEERVRIGAADGALDVDFCTLLGAAGAVTLAACRIGLVELGAKEAGPLLFPPAEDTVLARAVGCREALDGRVGIATTDAALLMAPGSRVLSATTNAGELAALRSTEHSAAGWNVYLDVTGQRHVARTDWQLDLAGDGVFVDGQFAFDHVVAVVGEATRVLVVTAAAIESSQGDGAALTHVCNLDEAPLRVGLAESVAILQSANRAWRLVGDRLEPWTGPVALPREVGECPVGSSALAWRDGAVTLAGRTVRLDGGPLLGAFPLGRRLWTVHPDGLRWLRLESRWLARLAVAEPGR
ncbi:MAG: hypothetical protein IPK26_20390 [Planctomycetes bacterium]|nr:hypothetical protein [Planctomycetota bacterium]